MKAKTTLSCEDRATLINSLTNAVSVLQQRSTTEKRTNVRENILPKHPDEFLMVLSDALKVKLIRTQIARMVANDYPRSAIEECVMFLPLLDVESELMSYGRLMVHGLREYPQLPQGKARRRMTAWQKQQCIALLRVVKTLEYEYKGVPPVGQSDTHGSFLTEEALVETVMEHADKVDVIVDIITERNLCTAEDIKPLLQSLHSSLAAGAL